MHYATRGMITILMIKYLIFIEVKSLKMFIINNDICFSTEHLPYALCWFSQEILITPSELQRLSAHFTEG